MAHRMPRRKAPVAVIEPGRTRVAAADVETKKPKGETASPCRIAAVGRRRDGGTRYWCLLHKADATAKYGRPATRCRYADIPALTEDQVRTLDLDDYEGGVALWGAVAPIYDTTRLLVRPGVHVHARRDVGGAKAIDATYRAVRLVGARLPGEGLFVSDLDAIYFMVSSVFGFPMKHVSCTHCGYSHLDKDFFSIHPHRRHLCSGCGKQFADSELSVGNPACRVRALVDHRGHRIVAARRKLSIRQGDYPGGLQIWGSNQALLWTAPQAEEKGIHIHAFEGEGGEPEINDTFAEVIIDGITLNARMVRVRMAQSALPHISARVVALICPTCGTVQDHTERAAFTPASTHACSRCGHVLKATGRFRKVIANPIIAVLDKLAAYAPRLRQNHSSGLIPETLGASWKANPRG